MRAVLGRIAALIRICLSGRNGKLGGIVFLVVLGLELSAIYLSILLVTWSKDFFDALEQLDADAAVWQIGVFAVLIGLSAGQFLLAQYLRKFVEITWRRTLTDAALDQWVGGRAYWYMRPGFSSEAIDNPDQRIADDCRLFLKGLLTEALDLIPAIVGLFSYVVLLWSLSTFPLEFTLFGMEVAIPRYMVWLSFIYVFVSSVITHRLGRPLKDLYFNQQKAEANLRYDLVRTREHATEIGMLGGEAAERRGIDRSFDGVATNWWRLMNRELILGLFTRPYFQTVLRIPIFFALPAYLAGAITFGGLMQLASAFSRVTNTLSWFLFSYKDLAEFVATSERLGGFFEATRAPTPSPDAPRDLVWRDSRDGALRLRGVNLVTPAGRRLAPVADLVIQPGERIWLAGDSGSGKSSLIAAMAGLWPYGEGQVETPAAERMFLPQKPYLPMTGLAEAAVYPADPAAMKQGEIERLIRDVGLAHRLPALSAEGATAVEGLSGGERQRLALARVLVASPDWIFLDEATSALDEKAEQELFALLLRRHPKATFVVAAHRPPVALSPYRRIDIAHPFPAIEMAIA